MERVTANAPTPKGLGDREGGQVGGRINRHDVEAFLLARISEEEDAASDSVYGDEEVGGPDSVFRQCAIRRANIEFAVTADHVDEPEWIEVKDKLLCALAAPYSAHPDYQQEWAL